MRKWERRLLKNFDKLKSFEDFKNFVKSEKSISKDYWYCKGWKSGNKNGWFICNKKDK